MTCEIEDIFTMDINLNCNRKCEEILPSETFKNLYSFTLQTDKEMEHNKR